MSGPRWLPIPLLVFALVAGAGFWLQRETNAALRSELQLLREERSRVDALRAEHERLVAAQLPPAELLRLRADRAALLRLRDEIAEMQGRVPGDAARGAAAGARTAASTRPPALVLRLAFGGDGSLTLDEGPFDVEAFKRRIAALPRGERIELLLQTRPGAPMEKVREALEALKPVVRASGVSMEMKFERAGI